MQTANGAVEKERVLTVELVTEERGELVEIHWRLADDEQRNVGRRDADTVA